MGIRFKAQLETVHVIALPATAPTSMARPCECESKNGEYHCTNVCPLATRTYMLQEPSHYQKAQRPKSEERARQTQRDRNNP
jgi:hypothetical protein